MRSRFVQGAVRWGVPDGGDLNRRWEPLSGTPHRATLASACELHTTIGVVPCPRRLGPRRN